MQNDLNFFFFFSYLVVKFVESIDDIIIIIFFFCFFTFRFVLIFNSHSFSCSFLIFFRSEHFSTESDRFVLEIVYHFIRTRKISGRLDPHRRISNNGESCPHRNNFNSSYFSHFMSNLKFFICFLIPCLIVPGRFLDAYDINIYV